MALLYRACCPGEGSYILLNHIDPERIIWDRTGEAFDQERRSGVTGRTSLSEYILHAFSYTGIPRMAA